MKTTLIVLTALLALPVSAFAHGDGTGVPGAQFLKEWDMSGTGSVSLTDMQTRRTQIFEMFDLNGDGHLDAPEGENMAQTVAGQQENNAAMRAEQAGQGQAKVRGQGGNGPGQVIHAAMTVVFNDADSNGLVTRQEFVDASAQIFAALDRNADSALTLDDFAR